MSDYNKSYYIDNVPWQRNLDYDKIIKFKDLKYGDIIVFHFDLAYSVFKSKQKTGYNSKTFISAINACLRYYGILRRLYPYNYIGIIIHLNSKIKIGINCDTFKAILNIIPHMAVDDTSNVYFDDRQHKHIFYGNFSGYISNLHNANYQRWSTVMGRLLIKEKI